MTSTKPSLRRSEKPTIPHLKLDEQKKKTGMHRGNPNWGKPEPLFREPSVSSFDAVVHELGLSPAQYESSNALREWVRSNKDHKYVPLDLLQIWGFTVRSEA